MFLTFQNFYNGLERQVGKIPSFIKQSLAFLGYDTKRSLINAQDIDYDVFFRELGTQVSQYNCNLHEF